MEIIETSMRPSPIFTKADLTFLRSKDLGVVKRRAENLILRKRNQIFRGAVKTIKERR